MSLDFWVETASPVKNPLREAFFEYAREMYEKDGSCISSYFPSVMGGDMPLEDYLINMNVENAPENYLGMGFGEISSRVFYEKYFKGGVYKENEIVAWFPETMVIDKKRLGARPVPESYCDLANPCYRGEICIIGTKDLPDPLTALYIFYERGEAAALQFIENIAGFGAPVNAIRHIGKSSNSFGSIFIMPLLFAELCSEINNALILKPKGGYYAEPFVLCSKKSAPEKDFFVKNFIHSHYFEQAFEEKCFFSANEKNNCLINPLCKKLYFPELQQIYKNLRTHLEKIMP